MNISSYWQRSPPNCCAIPLILYRKLIARYINFLILRYIFYFNFVRTVIRRLILNRGSRFKNLKTRFKSSKNLDLKILYGRRGFSRYLDIYMVTSPINAMVTHSQGRRIIISQIMTKMDQLIVDLQSLSGMDSCYVQRCSTCHRTRNVVRATVQ